MGKAEILNRISRNIESFLQLPHLFLFRRLCRQREPPAGSIHEEAKPTVSLEPNSALEELQLTRHCRIRPDAFCLKWETPVLSECGPVAFEDGLIIHQKDWTQKDRTLQVMLLPSFPEHSAGGVGFDPCHNMYLRPQDSRESAPKYPAANTAPAPQPRPGSPTLAQQDAPRATPARLAALYKRQFGFFIVPVEPQMDMYATLPPVSISFKIFEVLTPFFFHGLEVLLPVTVI